MSYLMLRRTAAGMIVGAAIAACTALRHQPTTPACCSEEGIRIADRYRVGAIAQRRFTHEQLWSALAPSLQGTPVRVTEIGRSVQGRPLRALTFGSGPVTVLLWSQMHGDESTATMALADIIAWLADRATPDALRERLASRLTVVMVPMLNPDGAELFQRENALGIDVNRDARRLVTPEARALKGLRDSIAPDFGFNLHDQNARTLTGPRGRQVAIALLAPASEETRGWSPTRTRARHIAAIVAGALAPHIGAHIARYDDAFEPRAFGDLMQQWGTSTVLIESGAMAGDPEKQRLRALNVVAITSALDAIATERYRSTSSAAYDDLSTNARAAVDLLVQGGSIVMPGASPVRADVTINYDESVQRSGPRIREVGDLRSPVALDTIDAGGMFIHPGDSALTSQGQRHWLRVGAPAMLTITRSAAPGGAVVHTIGTP